MSTIVSVRRVDVRQIYRRGVRTERFQIERCQAGRTLLDETDKVDAAAIFVREHAHLCRLRALLEIRTHAPDDLFGGARRSIAKAQELDARASAGDSVTRIDLPAERSIHAD